MTSGTSSPFLCSNGYNLEKCSLTSSHGNVGSSPRVYINLPKDYGHFFEMGVDDLCELLLHTNDLKGMAGC